MINNNLPEVFQLGKKALRTRRQEKDSQEKMIRELQGIFCKGQYRTWEISQSMQKKT